MHYDRMVEIEQELEEIERTIAKAFGKQINNEKLSKVQRKINKLLGIKDEEFLAMNELQRYGDAPLSADALQKRINRLLGLDGEGY